MTGKPPEAGVCVVRAEIQGEHVLISVTTSTGAQSSTQWSRPAAPRHYVDLDEALQDVSAFLHHFTDFLEQQARDAHGNSPPIR